MSEIAQIHFVVVTCILRKVHQSERMNLMLAKKVQLDSDSFLFTHSLTHQD